MGFQDSSWNIFYVKSGDPNCIRFEIAYCAEKQTDGSKNPSPATAIGVSNLRSERVRRSPIPHGHLRQSKYRTTWPVPLCMCRVTSPFPSAGAVSFPCEVRGSATATQVLFGISNIQNVLCRQSYCSFLGCTACTWCKMSPILVQM